MASLTGPFPALLPSDPVTRRKDGPGRRVWRRLRGFGTTCVMASIRASIQACILACALAVAAAVPARAGSSDDLLQALEIDAMIEVMRDEGLEYGQDLSADMFPGADPERWEALVREIYDPAKMRAVMHAHFSETLADTDVQPLIDFFTSEAGRRIVGLELSARRALIDDDLEQAAREAFQAADPDESRMRQLDRFVEVGDLLDANVTGALNASFHFYNGLVDGGALEMSQSDILSDVWSQETDTRADTIEWLYAFLLLAYEPLSDAQMEAYISLSATTEWRAMNRALFAGFNAMYDEISYALGLAAASQMQTQEL